MTNHKARLAVLGALLMGCACWLTSVQAELASAPPVECALDNHPQLATCPPIAQLLASEHQPAGVVFEVMENDAAAFKALTPAFKNLHAQLAEQIPDMPVLLVTHGNELFSFLNTENNASQNFLAFAQQEEITVTGCRFYTELRGQDVQALSEQIALADSATDYLDEKQAAGFLVIRLRTPNTEPELWLWEE